MSRILQILNDVCTSLVWFSDQLVFVPHLFVWLIRWRQGAVLNVWERLQKRRDRHQHRVKQEPLVVIIGQAEEQIGFVHLTFSIRTFSVPTQRLTLNYAGISALEFILVPVRANQRFTCSHCRTESDTNRRFRRSVWPGTRRLRNLAGRSRFATRCRCRRHS